MNNGTARVILKAHGIDPDADEETLTVAIEECGWQVSVEQPKGQGRSGQRPRWRALARQPPQLQEHRTGVHPHLRASGPSVQDVLVQMLAKVLERKS